MSYLDFYVSQTSLWTRVNGHTDLCRVHVIRVWEGGSAVAKRLVQRNVFIVFQRGVRYTLAEASRACGARGWGGGGGGGRGN